MKNFFDKINSLSLPAVILIASIILGGFYFASEVNKQKSIERQQNAKMNQEHKEYVAERKDRCYNIYFQERDNWSNVEGFQYDENKDVCLVHFSGTEQDVYTKEECEAHGEIYEFSSSFPDGGCTIEAGFTREF